MAIYKGQAFVHRLRCKTAAGAPANLTGIPMRMQIRDYPESSDVAIELSTANSRLVVQNDYIDIVLTGAETAAIPLTPDTGKKFFDIVRTDNLGRICGGRVTVKQGVSR